ncbi:MAG: hypothetical protein ACK5PP_18685 [Acidimicrobiales bacterium]
MDSPPHHEDAPGVPVAGIASWPLAGVVAAAVFVVFGALTLVRVAQGQPSAGSWAELTSGSPGAGVASPLPGDGVVGSPGEDVTVRIARQGDTYWGIAGEIAPGRDPRPVVDALVAANGSSTLQVGQRIVIPAGLAGGAG